jgi:hypothetical protein
VQHTVHLVSAYIVLLIALLGAAYGACCVSVYCTAYCTAGCSIRCILCQCILYCILHCWVQHTVHLASAYIVLLICVVCTKKSSSYTTINKYTTSAYIERTQTVPDSGKECGCV